MAETYLTKLNERIDRIVYIHYGTTENRIVEYVIEQNPGLEERDIILPLGITIFLPDLPAEVKDPTATQQIFLWS